MTPGRFGWLEPLLRRRVVAVIASGPSLTAEDCAAVRAAGLPAIVINTSFRMAPWADVLLAYDARWWQLHREEIAATVRGRRVTTSLSRSVGGAEPLGALIRYHAYGNSGTAAVSLCAYTGARAVILLGADCRRADDGRVHWHGDHPAQLSNARSMARWPKQYGLVAQYAARRGCRVVNASRQTALDCFERLPLQDALATLVIPDMPKASAA
jgi:hypothetical protein